MEWETFRCSVLRSVSSHGRYVILVVSTPDEKKLKVQNEKEENDNFWLF